MYDLRLILATIIIIVFGLIFTFVVASVLRRLINRRRYKILDRLREKFRLDVLKAITSDTISQYVSMTQLHAGSLEWTAMEYVLLDLVEREGQKKDVQNLFEAFGYTKYYHRMLLTHSSSIRISAAADKLGRMGAPSAIEPLFKMLRHKKAEVVTVALRAMCRLGTKQALQLILDELPTLIKNEKVSAKAIQTSLLLLEPWAGEVLLAFAGKMNDPVIIAHILETLIAFPASTDMFNFALTKISHPDPEVRAKALRVLARAESESFVCNSEVFKPSLNDPVWFVRLQAAKAIGIMKCENFIEMLKILALDERWQVRDAATFALVSIGEASMDTFLELLETPDQYAKESISEEIQRTGFVLDLIEYLGGTDSERKAKAERILTLMHRLGFSSSILEALQTHKNRPDITIILKKIHQTGGVK